MAWTAKFIKYDAENNQAHVEFTNGTVILPRTFLVPGGITNISEGASWLKEQSRELIRILTTKDVLSAAPTNVDVTPDAIIPPTPDPDLTPKQQFLQILHDLEQLDKAIALPITANVPNKNALTSASAPKPTGMP